jgi:hypothetical protein
MFSRALNAIPDPPWAVQKFKRSRVYRDPFKDDLAGERLNLDSRAGKSKVVDKGSSKDIVRVRTKTLGLRSAVCV